ncbi:Carboxylesterase type B [Penicillium antarcticum]|uniref:Carboxylesterase type B n=1 Tax=Penicillium antarcticum TaxID=416450 RepID=UPI00238E6F4F|nr:Carboxylesterase type B [Penicillium antarcticum]KAJ5313023.1 Carboxylesterase type B [Penicillium antarcticum]
MKYQFLLSSLLLVSQAFAAPSPKKNDKPCVSSHGGLRVLHYNNLGPRNNGTSAVLAYSRLTYADAVSKCVTIGENLHPWSSKCRDNQTQLGYELDYLIFAKELQIHDFLWISNEQQHGKDCYAFSISHKKVVQRECKDKYPVLCTSTPPPTTDQDGAARDTTKLSVRSKDYTLTGYRDARSFRFLGIPFANPPVKDLRFAPPQAYTGPKELDATTMAASCIQSLSSFGTLGVGGISEDCLYLNVYTPALPAEVTKKTALRPVAVYLYGGAFTKGSSAMVDYDGGNFASRSDVVVVTLNYRVGALGYLSTGNLTIGSYGTHDQIMALKWVQKHISSFGGDPSHVTVFGQSAGGQSTVALLSSTQAKGLFSGALVQSAPMDLPWFPRDLYAYYIAPEVGKAVGCENITSEKAFLKCLRSVPASNYLDNSTDFQSATKAISSSIAKHYYQNTELLSATEPFMPKVDDSGSGVIDDQFHTLLANNKLPIRVPTMFTTVRDEASLYTGRQVPNLGSTQVALDILLKTTYGSELAPKMISSGAFNVKKSDSDGVRNAASAALTYSEWTCAQGYILNQARSVLPSLYEVEITDGHIQTTVNVPDICSPNSVYNASCHSSDVLLAWGTLNSKTNNVDPYRNDEEIRHSQMLHDIFGSFFRTRNPNPDLEFLGVRGPAYAATREIFAGGEKISSHHEHSCGDKGYSIEQYHPSQRNLTLLGMPPSQTINFEDSDQCAVFRDYGFTFQRAMLTD